MRIKGWGQGVNKDQPAWELDPGVWSDCLNMRFINGKAQRVGGIASVITPSITPYFLAPYSSGSTKYVFYAGTTKAYVHDGTTETEVTPAAQPSPVTITAATYVSIGSNTVKVTITATGHGLLTNDIVSTSGLVPSQINKAGVSITKVDANTFYYTFFSFGIYPTSPQSANVSAAYYTVDSSAGVGATINFTNTIDDKVSGGNFNGVFFYNNPVDGAYYWDQANSGRLHHFSDSIVGVQDAVRCFLNYIFLLAPTTSGTKYRHRLHWSQAADPGSVPSSFTPSSTNDAGFVDLVSEGELVDGQEWGGAFFAYKRDKRFRVVYIGGQYVFDTHPIASDSDDDGCLAVGCIANTPKGQVYLTNGLDVRIHQGAQSSSIAQGVMKDYLATNMNSTYRKRSFLCINSKFKEVWVCYPKTGQTFPSEALIWNWDSDTWGLRALSNVTCGGSGILPSSIATDTRLLLANTTPKIGLTESGTTDFGSAYTSTLERTGIDFGSPVFKAITKSMWLWKGSTTFTGTAYHGSSKTQDGSVTWTAGATYTHQTSFWLDGGGVSESGPYLGIKWSFSPSDTPSLISIDIEGDNIKTQGRY